MEIIPNYHPMLVHFSVALLSIAAVFYSASLLFGSRDPHQTLLAAARWNLWGGAAISLVTVLTGWLAYNSVAHDGLSHQAMTLHMQWALPTLGLWLVAATWGFLARNTKPTLIFLMFVWLSTGSLLVTGYLGAENVYRHGIGVMRLPVSTGDGHDHDHDHDHGNGHNAAEIDAEKGAEHDGHAMKKAHQPMHQGHSPTAADSHDTSDDHKH